VTALLCERAHNLRLHVQAYAQQVPGKIMAVTLPNLVHISSA
jgi:hypothetical protein